MEKEFIPYELAIKLKALGFDEPCFAGYRHSKWIGTDGPNSRYFHAQLFSNHQFDEDEQEYCSAPLFQQAFRWFREKYGLDSSIIREKVKVDEKWIKTKFYMYSITNDEDFPLSLGFDLKDNATYEEAELACLNMLIEIVESKSE